MQRQGFRNKGNKAFQLCAKPVLTVIHTFVSDNNYIREDDSYPHHLNQPEKGAKQNRISLELEAWPREGMFTQSLLYLQLYRKLIIFVLSQLQLAICVLSRTGADSAHGDKGVLQPVHMVTGVCWGPWEGGT